MKTALEYSNSFDIKKLGKYAVKNITRICNEIGPRKPGSPEELKAQKLMAKDLEKSCDEVTIEEFKVHRQAFMGFIPFTVACAVASVFTYAFASPIISLILVILGFIPLLLEFVMYKKFIDPLFIGHPSHNVIAKRAPKSELKKRFIEQRILATTHHIVALIRRFTLQSYRVKDNRGKMWVALSWLKPL